jgi:hypothetical protein
MAGRTIVNGAAPNTGIFPALFILVWYNSLHYSTDLCIHQRGSNDERQNYAMDIRFGGSFYLFFCLSFLCYIWVAFTVLLTTRSHHVHTLTLDGKLYLAPIKDDIQVKPGSSSLSYCMWWYSH